MQCLKLFRSLQRTTGVRYFHPSVNLLYKKFRNTENEFSYKVINCGVIKYDDIKATKQFKDENWNDKSIETLVKGFEGLAAYCRSTGTCLSDDRFDSIVECLVENAKSLSFDQLKTTLIALSVCPETESTFTKNFAPLWTRLDAVCCENIKDWKVCQLLEVCDLWYNVNLSKTGRFTFNALRKISRKFKKLSNKEFIQTAFYINMCRRTMENMFDLELKLQDCVDELTINEAGIVCVGFFKTESKLHLPLLVEKLYRKLEQNIETVEDITLVNILKILRYSSDPLHSKYMSDLFQKLIPQMKRFSIISNLHIGLLGTNIQACNDNILEAIVQRFSQNIKSTRLKEIERVAFIVGLFNYKSPAGTEKVLLQQVIVELKLRVDEIVKHPKCLSACAYYLTLSGLNDPEIIDSVLKPDFISLAYGKNHFSIGREILCLDSYTRINLKDTYKGTHLDVKMTRNIAKYKTHYVPTRDQKYKLTHADQLLLNVKELSESIYGPSILTHILPHYERPDIIHLFDENKQPISSKITNCLPSLYSGDILSKEFLFSKDKHLAEKMNQMTLIAFVVGGWNFYVRDTSKLTGVLQMKMEQLQLSGYETILIPWFEFSKMNELSKSQFLKSNVDEILKCKQN